MMKYLQKLGKALMLPVAVLPICGILMGLGYALAPGVMACSTCPPGKFHPCHVRSPFLFCTSTFPFPSQTMHIFVSSTSSILAIRVTTYFFS